jgi:hypothetical protein
MKFEQVFILEPNHSNLAVTKAKGCHAITTSLDL